jgi:hypothetical protein
MKAELHDVGNHRAMVIDSKSQMPLFISLQIPSILQSSFGMSPHDLLFGRVPFCLLSSSIGKEDRKLQKIGRAKMRKVIPCNGPGKQGKLRSQL